MRQLISFSAKPAFRGRSPIISLFVQILALSCRLDQVVFASSAVPALRAMITCVMA